MCGRFTLEPTATFYERFQIANRLDSLIPRYNIAPGQMVPVVISQSPNQVVMRGSRRLRLSRPIAGCWPVMAQ